MGKVEKGSFALSSTGESGWLYLEDEEMTPDYFEFTIGARVSTNETHVIHSTGIQDLVNDRKTSFSIFDDGSVRGSRRSTSESFTHYKNVSSTLTKVIGGYVSAVEAGRFKVTLSLADSAYNIDFLAVQLT